MTGEILPIIGGYKGIIKQPPVKQEII
ncbi:hypothetical protein [Hanamia caeni]